MIVDLVQVRTSDGLRLDGAWLAGSSGAPDRCAVDALLLVHGTGANFYASSLLEAIAKHFAAEGVAVLLANTRGRDLLYTAATNNGPRRMGAACERIDECRIDLAAWIDWLHARGHPRIGLIGHSLGAIKGVYALAQPDAPPVACLCAISPARLSHDYFLAGPQGDEFRRTLERAQRLVDDGHGETLMEVELPIPYVVTAASYLDKYGPGERFNVLTYVGKLAHPTLFMFGSVEVQNHVAFRGLPEAIEAVGADPAAPSANVRVAVVAGGDHVYSGVRAELIGRIEGWLGRLPGGDSVGR